METYLPVLKSKIDIKKQSLFPNLELVSVIGQAVGSYRLSP